MDFNELIKPYSEGDRTPEAQVKWLLSKGIPRHCIDQAMLLVYDEIERGRIFEATEEKAAGTALDHEIWKVAQELHKVELQESIEKSVNFYNQLVQRHRDESAAEVIARMQKPLNFLQRFGKWLFRL